MESSLARSRSWSPRAYWVSHAGIVPDAAQLLERLASIGHDPRAAVLIEEPPADGFLGPTDRGLARAGRVVEFEDHMEAVRLRVRADGPGLLVLTDQHYPGWVAKVNREKVPILRANYAFRTVRVPPGDSTVDFFYRPKSVRYGLRFSGATLLLLALGAGAYSRRLR